MQKIDVESFNERILARVFAIIRFLPFVPVQFIVGSIRAILPKRQGTVEFNIVFQQATFFEVSKMIITTEQKFTVQFSPRTAAGNPATVDGIPLWSLSVEDGVVDMEVAKGGMSVEIFARGIGQTLLSVTADADLGEGIRDLFGVLDISVIGAEATTIVLEPGPVELQ